MLKTPAIASSHILKMVTTSRLTVSLGCLAELLQYCHIVNHQFPQQQIFFLVLLMSPLILS